MELPRRTTRRRIRVSVGQQSKSNQVVVNHLARLEATEVPDLNSNSCRRPVGSQSMEVAVSAAAVALAAVEVPQLIVEAPLAALLPQYSESREVPKTWDGIFRMRQVSKNTHTPRTRIELTVLTWRTPIATKTRWLAMRAVASLQSSTAMVASRSQSTAPRPCLC